MPVTLHKLFHRFMVPLALVALLTLTACRSSMDLADAYEAQYDQMMAVRAYPAALSSIRKAVSYDDSNARRYMKLAEVELVLNQSAAAAVAFQAALDLEPANIEALQNLSMLSVRAGQFDNAKRYIDPLLSLSADDPAGLLSSGAIALGERRFKDALVLSDKIIAALPGRADGFVLKARALDAMDRSRDAVTLLENRLLVADDGKDLLVQLMALYRKMGDQRGIRATAIRLMPLFPDDPRYALESARAYHARGDEAEVRTIIDDLLKRFGRQPDVLLAIGELWRDILPLPVARAEIAKLAAASPPRVRTALADQLIDLGGGDDAIALLGALAPTTITAANVDSQTHYARALLVTGKIAAARAKDDAVLAYDSRNPEAMLIRARLKLLRRDYRGAFTDAQLIANDDEQNEEAALLVPEIYAAQGNQLLAAGAYGSARQRFPDSITALRAEVEWLISQKRTEEAGQRVASFKTAHPRDGAASRIYKDVCAKTRAAACGTGISNVARMIP